MTSLSLRNACGALSVILLCVLVSGCDQVLKRLVEFPESKVGEKNRSSTSELKAKEVSENKDESTPTSQNAVNEDWLREGSALRTRVSKSHKSPFDPAGPTVTSDETLSTPFTLSLDQEFDVGNGLIFDMRPNLPEIRQSK